MKTTSATACTRVGMSLMSLLTMPENTMLLLLVTTTPCRVSSCPGPRSPVYCRAMMSRGLVCPATSGPATQPVSPGSSGHLTVPPVRRRWPGPGSAPVYTIIHYLMSHTIQTIHPAGQGRTASWVHAWLNQWWSPKRSMKKTSSETIP